jgi:hypothetical protein
MKTTTLLKTLPVLGLTLALSACGGDEDDGGPVNPGQTGSITACFTADKTVNYAVATSGVPSGQVGVSRITVGPMTYRNQAVTGQTIFYISGSTTYTDISYWTVTGSGVTFIAGVGVDGSVTPSNLFYPQNMSPGQTMTSSDNTKYTLIGFESISLAGKMFFNTCHIKKVDNQGSVDAWLAPGYGNIKSVYSNGGKYEYSGDL